MNDFKIISGKRSGKWESTHLPKKLMIKNFAHLETSVEYQTESWAKLESAIFSILNPNFPNVDCVDSLEDLYQAVQNLCSRNDKVDSETYRKLKNIIQNYVKDTLLKQFDQVSDQSFLLLLEQCWSCFCVQLKMIRNIFLYLDRTYVLKCPHISSIWDMGLEIFRDIVVLNKKILPKIIESVLDLISKDRQNPCSERMNEILNIRNCIRMLLDLSVYELFEADFLRESQRYFSSECVHNVRFVGSATPEKIVSYLEFIDRKLTDETSRMTAIQLDQHPTYKKLVFFIEKELIAANLDMTFSGNNFDALFDDLKYINSVKLAYSLFERVPNGADKMCACFNLFVKGKGKSMIHLAGADPEKEKTLIQELIDFKGRMDRVVRECFTTNDRQFSSSLKEAFENFINVRTNKMAELIAKFVDGKLRQANFDSEQLSFDQLLDKVMVMFRFIHGKDIFEAFYQRDLAKRLLGGKSASVDAEKLMLLKLKQECGGAFTSKLESMFKDIELSRELTGAFKKYLTKSDVSQSVSMIDMNVSVLTTGIWPTYQSIELLVSPDLQQYEQVFSQFYLAKHQGRKLQWQHGFGHCLLKAYFTQGDKELQVSFIQALVLLQFNQKDELTLDEIRTALLPKDVKPGEEKELRRTLQSLACGKVRVLSKEPKGREILDEDYFIYNSAFEHKLFRIKINQIQWKETFEENVATQERVSQDRQYQLDAAIVRIMKARKTLPHNELVSEIYSKVNFPAAAAELKKRIDSLIERDYMRRDKDNQNKYNYVA